MRSAYTVAQIRAAEESLMAQVPEGALMRRAAAGLATICSCIVGDLYGARFLLLVGPGNNGGDALFAGARLARRGAAVSAILLRPDRVHPEGFAAFSQAGGVIAADTVSAVRAADVVIDGILGIGARGGLRTEAAALAKVLSDEARHVVAVDLPSGVDADTGELPGAHVVADTTVTFGVFKPGLVVDPAAAAAGNVHLVDIGLQPHVPASSVEVLTDADVASLLPIAEREAHKYSRGVVGIRAGSQQFPGAAMLCCAGAFSGPVGIVRYVGPPDVGRAIVTRWPHMIVSDDLSQTGRVQSWVVGPGLGDRCQEDVDATLAQSLPTVLDADALRYLPDRFEHPVVLTPHAGELARLLDVSRGDIEARRLHYASRAAQRWNATVLLKGTTTVVVSPDGRVRVNPTGTSALATAGTGDILAGLVGALLAAGLDSHEAGSLAAYLHGLAGQRASRMSGYPTASAVMEELPAVITNFV